MPSLFVSYSRVDGDFAVRLASALSELGIDVWMDIEDIPAGKRWSTAIQEGLDICESMLVIITPESMKSRNVEDEWQYFLECGKPVVPILLKPTKVHYQLSRVHYIDFYRYDFPVAFTHLHAELLRLGFKLSVDTAELRAVRIAMQKPLDTLDVTERTRPRSRVWQSRSMPAAAQSEGAVSGDTIPIVGTEDETRQVQRLSPPRAGKPGLWRALLIALAALTGGLLVSLTQMPHLSGLPGMAASLTITPQMTVETVDETAVPPTEADIEAVPSASGTATADEAAAIYALIAYRGAVSLREGPSTEFPRIDTAQSGERFIALGQNPARTWYLVLAPGERLLWLASSYVALSPSDADLPVVRSIGSVTMTAASPVYGSFTDRAAQIGLAAADSVLPLIGRADADDREWYQVLLPNGQRGWVSSETALARLARIG